MKKSILLLTLTALTGYVTLSSYQSGPAFNGQNRTGAKNSTANCSDAGCHGTASFGANTVIGMVVDSSLTPVTRYKAGKTYTIMISGASISHPKYGFEFTAVSGTGGAQVNAGTFTSLPANVHSANLGGLTFIEHSSPLAGVNPGNGYIYTTSFSWTAPLTQGTGDIHMYCTLNAVNGDGNADAGDTSNNTMITLTELLHTADVPMVGKDLIMAAFPNPASSSLKLSIPNAQSGNYTVRVFDIAGRQIFSKDVAVNGVCNVQINTGAWSSGLYYVRLQGEDGSSKSVAVSKL